MWTAVQVRLGGVLWARFPWEGNDNMTLNWCICDLWVLKRHGGLSWSSIQRSAIDVGFCFSWRLERRRSSHLLEPVSDWARGSRRNHWHTTKWHEWRNLNSGVLWFWHTLLEWQKEIVLASSSPVQKEIVLASSSPGVHSVSSCGPCPHLR